jgi:hypothetical protein
MKAIHGTSSPSQAVQQNWHVESKVFWIQDQQAVFQFHVGSG